MAWNVQREIPNFWAYADKFVLQDAMFEPVDSYSPALTSVHGFRMVRQMLESR